jgi:hypothetical protein
MCHSQATGLNLYVFFSKLVFPLILLFIKLAIKNNYWCFIIAHEYIVFFGHLILRLLNY